MTDVEYAGPFNEMPLDHIRRFLKAYDSGVFDKVPALGQKYSYVIVAGMGGSGVVGFGGSAPGKVLDVDVSKGSWMVQNTGYLCSENTVNVAEFVAERNCFEAEFLKKINHAQFWLYCVKIEAFHGTVNTIHDFFNRKRDLILFTNMLCRLKQTHWL